MKGFLYIAAASMIWGIAYFFRKVLLVDVSPIVLTFYTYLSVSLMLLTNRDVVKSVIPAFEGDKFSFLVLGGIGSIASFLFYLGLDLIPVSISVLIERIQPIFAVVLAYYFLGEKFPLRKYPWAFLTILSCYLLVLNYEDLFARDGSFLLGVDFSLAGILYISSASFLWALAGVVGKKVVKKHSPKIVTAIRVFVGTFVMGLTIFPSVYSSGFSALSISLYALLLIVILSFFSNLYGYILFYKGLETTDVGIACFIELLTPVSSIALGVLYLGEDFSVYRAISALALIVSVIMLSRDL